VERGPQHPHRQQIRGRVPTVIGIVLVAAALALIPWIVYLSMTLPATYQAQNWGLAWIGLDVALVIMLGTTALLTWTRHPQAGMSSMATAALLLCDAWFDWSTSAGADHTWATWTALLVELPTAALLLANAIRPLRRSTALPGAVAPAVDARRRLVVVEGAHARLDHEGR
jgi:hypothetical protein